MDDSEECSVDAHYDEVYGFVRRRSRSSEDAEDVTQAVFASAAEHRDLRFDSRPVLPWLYTVARRRLADHERRLGRTIRSVELTHDVASGSTEYGSEVRSALIEALRTLPEGQRTVVVWRLVNGHGFGEISLRLSITETAARMRFSRGLAAIREAMEKEGIEA